MSPSQQQPIGLVLIHGAGLGAWIWDKIDGNIAAPHLAIDLPKRNETKEARAQLTLEDYTLDALKQIEALPVDKVVVVAHSLGGIIGLQVADRLGERLAGFVAVSAALPANGAAFTSVLPFPQSLIMPVILKLAGTQPPPAAIKTGLCNDLDDTISQQVVDRYAAESLAVYKSKLQYNLPAVSSLYIRLTNDKEFSPQLQSAMAQRLPNVRVHDLASGHLPMLSQPVQLAAMINDFVASLS